MRWRHTKGMPVVNTSTAETIGNLGRLVIDAEAARVVALDVGGQMVSWSDAGGIGRDAVTVGDVQLMHPPGSALELAAKDGVTDPFSKPVFTDDGRSLGDLDDIEFDPENGEIRNLLLTEGEVSGSQLIGIGSHAVVVAADVTDSDATAGREQHKAEGGLSSLTKAELYEKAKSRDLHGRSSMSKDELIEALS